MLDILPQHIPTTILESTLYIEKQIRVSVLRLDLVHPVISGNKWFKLQYYLREAIAEGKKKLVTYGGAYSNHIVATAAAAKYAGLESIGIIRGEEAKELSPTLQSAKSFGMELIFTARDAYAKKWLPAELISGENYLVNEGGYGTHGARGIADMQQYFATNDYTDICCAVGTGTTMAGLINSSSYAQRITGVSVMKNNTALEDAVRHLLVNPQQDVKMMHDYHFGGYAKYTATLVNYMNECYQTNAIPTDFVYTGKLFYAVNDLIQRDHFPAGSNVLIIHTGGLQGNSSLKEGTLIF